MGGNNAPGPAARMGTA
jgi:intraflagellar transport protein 74